MYDERPFEHEFFLQIAQSFPLMEKLSLHNRKSQRNDNKQQWSIIEYPHLTIALVHESYVEQFLVNTRTCLSNDVHIYVAYKCLRNVTQHFTRDVTRMNCSKVNSLALFCGPECFEHLKDYFPNAEIF